MFDLNLYPHVEYKAKMDGDVRYYQVYDELDIWYPSVTSIIGASTFFDHSYLAAWRKAVGDEEADRITKKAGRRGTALHNCLEKYVKGQDWKKSNPAVLFDMLPIKNILDKNVNNVRGIEITLFNDFLETAGTSDLIADWKGKPAIIDYKTKRFSHRPVSEDDFSHYYVQAACYAYMCNMKFQSNIEDIVIIMSLEHQEPIVFEKKVLDYKDLMMRVFSQYNRNLIKSDENKNAE